MAKARTGSGSQKSKHMARKPQKIQKKPRVKPSKMQMKKAVKAKTVQQSGSKKKSPRRS